MGSTAMDPTMMPAQEEALANYGKEEIAALANFYGYLSLGKPQLVDPGKLIGQCEGFKKFVFKKKLEWDAKHESDLETAKAHLNAEENRKPPFLLYIVNEKLQRLIKTKSLKTKIEKLTKTITLLRSW